MKNAELHKVINGYKTLSEQIAALEEQRTALADKIKRHMGDAEEMQIDDTTVRYKSVTSSRFDTKAFQTAYTALYQQFCKAATTRRLTVA